MLDLAQLVAVLTFVPTGLAPLGVLAAVRLARLGRYEAHRRLQLAVFLCCWAAVVTLEIAIRLNGGSGSIVGATTPAARAWMFGHIGVAMLTYAVWTLLVVRSWRRFQIALPGGFSPTHRRLGWLVFGGLAFTAVTSAGMVVMVVT